METNTRQKAIEWWGKLQYHEKGKLRPLYVPEGFDPPDEEIEKIYLSEHRQDNNTPNSEWYLNSIDGDNAIVSDESGFIMEAPDEETGRKIVLAVNNFANVVEALEPFKKLADEVFKDTQTTAKGPLYGFNNATITYEDLQRVIAALSKLQ